MSIIDSVESKINSGRRIACDEAVALFKSGDVIRLGRIADQVKRSRWGRRAHFVVNRQINPTNICALSCRFCDFARKAHSPSAYEMTIQDVLDRCHPELSEVHIVGGLHPTWSWERYLEIVRAIKMNFPQIQIKAWTAVEIDFFAKKFRISVKDILSQMQEAGLSALPGGGAEVFSERVRKALYPFKIGGARWIEIHRIAHRMGIPTNSTLLYGHIETYEERIGHMARLRELQDETGGFMGFIPLAYQPGRTQVVSRAAGAIDDLKTIAVARIFLDNVPHIKAYWVTMGESIASIALHFGADDVDGTIGDERVMHAARASSPVGLTRDRLIRMIEEAGCTPIERDALYNTINAHGTHAHCENTVS